MSNNEVRLWGGWVSYIYEPHSSYAEFFFHKSIVSFDDVNIPKIIRLVSPKTKDERLFIKSEHDVWYIPETQTTWKDKHGGFINGRMFVYNEEFGSMKLHLMMDR